MVTILSVVAIVLGAAILLAVTTPIGEAEGLASSYDALYYVMAGAIALLGGLMVTIGLILSATLVGLIELAHPEGSNRFLAEERPNPDTTQRD